ncbi:hypothetical protein AVEN_67794-1 [Araneus ventricosus]|uniref:Retrotransposon gag domain-containing protein n=1 Tax=Araneus ventricosus TaxID=182803 RepID=A0A4Y2J4I6_ARAVE|nr:hypothetical protein AVEN_67794-1 [Araneus ventricosus]
MTKKRRMISKKKIKKTDSFEGESSNKRDSSMQCEAQCNMQCCDMQCDANKIYDMEFVDKHRSSVVQNTVINYSDIESAISKFNAESHENIANWLDYFENISQLFSLSDLQKFIFAKRSLGGTAALFVRTEPQINSWQNLKQALIDEFSFEINSAHLHELLSKRKMRDSESAPEYFLKMKELCSSGKIEDAALMYYVIKGINDRQEKTIFYGYGRMTPEPAPPSPNFRTTSADDLFEHEHEFHVLSGIVSDPEPVPGHHYALSYPS